MKPSSVIDVVATGKNIRMMMDENNLTVLYLQNYIFDFGSPQAIYKWLRGASLPTIRHLAILAAVLGVSMDEIVVANIAAYPAKARGQKQEYGDDSTEAVRKLLAPRCGQLTIPNVNAKATGERIEQLMSDAGITVREMQEVFGFKTPQAIYKWLYGTSLPTIGHLAILAAVLGVSMDGIVVVDVTVLSMPEGRIISAKKDVGTTMATAIRLLRAGKTDAKACG